MLRFLIATLLASALGCVHVGPAERPHLSQDPKAGPASCYSECTVFQGCHSVCGYKTDA